MDKIKEDKERVLENIVQELLPFEISTTNEGGQSELVYYEELAHVFNQSVSTEGYNKFVAAVDEIYTAYTTVCEGITDVPGSGTIAGLAASFDEVTQGFNIMSAESLSQARSIYGELLCYQEKQSIAGRKRRQVPPSMCARACPEEITDPCHFFACLSVSIIQHIMGFGNSGVGEPCIGFLVDTTGSMSVEIAAAKRVILQFIKSQADTTNCYLLVPFNDFDNTDSEHLMSKLFSQKA